MHEPTKYEVPQIKGGYDTIIDRDIQLHAWPIQCQQQSLCIGHCSNNKRTQNLQAEKIKVFFKSTAEFIFIPVC